VAGEGVEGGGRVWLSSYESGPVWKRASAVAGVCGAVSPRCSRKAPESQIDYARTSCSFTVHASDGTYDAGLDLCALLFSPTERARALHRGRVLACLMH
jgi:hypothetical protein